MNSGVVKKPSLFCKFFFLKTNYFVNIFKKQQQQQQHRKGFVFFFFHYFVNGSSNIEKFVLNFCDKCLTMSRSLMDVLGLEVS